MISAALCACAIQALQGWAVHPAPAPLDTLEVRALAVDPAGAVWVGARRGLARIEGPALRWMEGEAGELPAGIADLRFVDGTLWATGLGGASHRTDSGWTLRAEFGGLSPRVVFGVALGTDDSVWLGTSSGALLGSGERWSSLTAEDGLPHPVVHEVVPERNGPTWLLTRGGLARWDGQRVATEVDGLNYRTGLIGPDGEPWFGTTDGIRRRHGGEWVEELHGITVFPRAVDGSGVVWAGSASRGVFRFSGGLWEALPLPARYRDAEVFDVEPESEDRIWVATAAGLLLLEREGPGG